MIEDAILDEIREKRQKAFERQQELWAKYDEANRLTSEALEAMKVAWDERVAAREEMDREFKALQAYGAYYNEVWDAYGEVRRKNTERIVEFRRLADLHHAEMQKLFNEAAIEHSEGRQANARQYSEQAYKQKDARNALNVEIGRLAKEITAAHRNAEEKAPPRSSEAYKAAKARFERARINHDNAQSNYKILKLQRDLYQAEFREARSETARLKDEFNNRLLEAKIQKACKDKVIIGKVNAELARTNPVSLGTVFGKSAKIVKRTDGSGKIDVYFSTSDTGDGIGHGHAVIDKNGNVSYLRDIGQNHDEFLIDDNARRNPKGE